MGLSCNLHSWNKSQQKPRYANRSTVKSKFLQTPKSSWAYLIERKCGCHKSTFQRTFNLSLDELQLIAFFKFRYFLSIFLLLFPFLRFVNSFTLFFLPFFVFFIYILWYVTIALSSNLSFFSFFYHSFISFFT